MCVNPDHAEPQVKIPLHRYPLVVSLYRQGYQLSEIGHVFQCSVNAIRVILVRCGEPRARAARGRSNKHMPYPMFTALRKEVSGEIRWAQRSA